MATPSTTATGSGTTAAANLEAPPPGRRWSLARRLRERAVGSDKRIAVALRFGLATMLQHCGWALLYAWSSRDGAISDNALHLLVTINLIGVVGFYPWVRMGWTLHLPDSGLVQPQMLWASLSGVLGFAFAPTLRPAALQLLCMIQIYGFFGLRPRQLAVTGGGAASMLVGALLLGTIGGPAADFDLGQEVYPALLTVFVLGCMTAITIDYSLRRSRMSVQKIELNTAVAAVRDLVIRDTLTGLFNRRHMQALLQEEHARALRTGRPFAVALLDIDHFKRINDTHGHGIGDDALCHFAELATVSMRQSDSLARWGGEEFLVLMPETSDEREALAALERLRSELRRQDSASLLARIGLTFSAGIAFHHADQALDQVVDAADRALYSAKGSGRNRLAVEPAAGRLY